MVVGGRAMFAPTSYASDNNHYKKLRRNLGKMIVLKI
jgi:hypothetical protein